MDKFEILNRQTNEYNSRNVNRFNQSSEKTTPYWMKYNNNQVYKNNNGQYPSRLY